MKRSAFGRLAPFVVLFLIAACGGDSNETPSSPTSPSPSPSPSPSTCNTTASGVPQQVTSRGGAFSFNVSSAGNCTWTARTDAQWASVSPGSGTGNATLTLQFLETASTDSRTLNLSINTQNYRIVQQGVGCVYTLNIPTTTLGNDGGPWEFGLTTAAGCSWSVTSNEGWITIGTPNGSGSGPIRFTVAKNTGPTRQAIVTMAGQQVTFTQASGN